MMVFEVYGMRRNFVLILTVAMTILSYFISFLFVDRLYLEKKIYSWDVPWVQAKKFGDYFAIVILILGHYLLVTTYFKYSVLMKVAFT